MSDLNLNIKFNYLYRDAGNYKQYGSVIFTNPNHLLLEVINTRIRSLLTDGEFFDHTKWHIPTLFFDKVNEDDHDWHEFENIVATEESPTDKRTIDELIS